MILYFVDDKLEGIYNGKTFSYSFKESVFKGQIINKDKFILEFNSLIKKEKIKYKLFGNSVSVIKEPFYTPAYLFYLENILEEAGFVKINYILMEDILDDRDTFIVINEKYMNILGKIFIYIDLELFKDIVFIINYFKVYYKGNIIMFGKNKNIPIISREIGGVYYCKDYTNYIINCLYKCNK